MINEEVVVGMINAIIKINNAIFPLSLIIPIILKVLFIIGIVLSYKKNMTRYLNILIGCCYLYAGFPLLFTSEQLGIKAYLGGSILLVFSSIFFLLLLVKKNIFLHTNIKIFRIAGVLLIVLGVLIYPVIEYLAGFSWPGIAVFGMECPTTIAVIGLLILSFGNSSKILLSILCINASFTGTGVAINGALFDWSYAIAGYIGIIILFIDVVSRRKLTTAVCHEEENRTCKGKE